MPEGLLNDPKVTGILEQVSCKRVPQQVRVNVLFQSDQAGELLHKLPDPSVSEWLGKSIRVGRVIRFFRH